MPAAYDRESHSVSMTMMFGPARTLAPCVLNPTDSRCSHWRSRNERPAANGSPAKLGRFKMMIRVEGALPRIVLIIDA